MQTILRQINMLQTHFLCFFLKTPTEITRQQLIFQPLKCMRFCEQALLRDIKCLNSKPEFKEPRDCILLSSYNFIQL